MDGVEYVLMVTKFLNWKKFDAISSDPMNRYSLNAIPWTQGAFPIIINLVHLQATPKFSGVKMRSPKEVHPSVFPSAPNTLSRIMSSRIPVTQKIAW